MRVSPGALVGMFDGIENPVVVDTGLREGSEAKMLGVVGLYDKLGWLFKVCEAVGPGELLAPVGVIGGSVGPTCSALGDAVVTSGNLVVSGTAVGLRLVVGSVEEIGMGMAEGSDVGLCSALGFGLTLGCCLMVGNTVAAGEVLGSADTREATGAPLGAAFGDIVAPDVACGLYDAVGSTDRAGCRLVKTWAVGDTVRSWVGPADALGCPFVGAVGTLGCGRDWMSSL